MREPNISSWRRRTFGDLTAAFRFGEAPARPPVLPSTSGQFHLGRYTKANLPSPPLPGADQTPPEQEAGERKRIPPA